MKRVILFLMCIFIGACSGSANRVIVATDTPAPSLTATLRPTDTRMPTHTATLPPSPTMTQTPTRTTVPQGMIDQINLTYRMIILVNGNASYLLQLAEAVRDRKISDIQKLALILGLIELVDQAEQQMKDFRPFPALDDPYDRAVYVHEKIKNYLNNWLSRMIESPELASEMAPLVVYMDDAIDEAEGILGSELDFDPAEMAAARAEILRTIDEFFITPTP